MTNKIERLIDANYNRLKEALRLLEDIQRFIYDNKELSYAFKELRHNLTSLYSQNATHVLYNFFLILITFCCSYRTVVILTT